MDDRERATDGNNHVGNGALARAAARNGSNGADPVLEEMVSSWRRRVAAPSDEEPGTDEPPVARGRAEVPGPPFATDPADVNRVPFIPQQSQPRHHDEPPPVPEQAPADPEEGDDPPRRADRHSYDERARYQRPFRFRQRPEDGPQHGRAEAQFGPAEFGPPEYRPPEYRPPEQSRPWQPEHRNTGPEFGHNPAHGTPPRPPAPFGAPDAPVSPAAPPPPGGQTPPFGVAPQPEPAAYRPEPVSGPPQPGPPFAPPRPEAAPAYGEPVHPAPGYGNPADPSSAYRAMPGEPTTAFGGQPAPQPPTPFGGQPTAFGGEAPAQPTAYGQAPFGGEAPAQPTAYGQAPFGGEAPGQPASFGQAPGQPAPFGQAPGEPAPFGGPVPARPTSAPPTSPEQPPAASPVSPAGQFRPVHRNDGSHGATIDPPRFSARSSRSIRPMSAPPAADPPQQQPPSAVVPPPLIPPFQGAQAPVVPAPLIPPVSPAPDPRWAGGPWSDSAWAAGTSPSVGWQAAAPTSPADQAPPAGFDAPSHLRPATPTGFDPGHTGTSGSDPGHARPAGFDPGHARPTGFDPGNARPVSPAEPPGHARPLSPTGFDPGRVRPVSPADQGRPSAPGDPTRPLTSGYPSALYPSAGAEHSPLPPPPPPVPDSDAFDGGLDLPQRVPSAPDVPQVPGAEGLEGSADEAPADLSRIADYFRNEDPAEERRDGFDFPAVIDAVQGVVGVREAEIVNIDGRHTLRLDLSDDADPGEVSRAVARLLKEQMGVSAEPTRPPSGAAAPVEGVGRPEAVPVPAVVEEAVKVTSDSTPADPPEPLASEGPAATVEPTGPTGPTGIVEPPEPAAMVEPPELTEQTGMTEPPELAPTSDPVPARLADLPRVGEPPTSADSVRVASVPGRPDLPAPRAGRPSDERPLRARLADIEPDLSFEAWLEAIRPGAERPARPADEEEPEEETAKVDEPEEEREEPEDEHQSLVGMPMAPVFTDPTEQTPVEEEPASRRELQPLNVVHQPVPELGLPNAPAFQFAGSGGRVRLEQVEVNSHGLDAEVQVRLSAGGTGAVGHAVGPAVDGYMLRLSATATAGALDALLTDPDSGTRIGRCYIEHATVVPLGTCEIALVVMLIVSGGFAEQLSGSAIVAGDVRQAVVRATLAAANRRLDALLP